MALNVAAIVVLVIFYIVILVVGLVAAWKVKVKGHESGSLETILVAGRDLTGIVGIFTMIATTVGGGYINGTAESVAKDGLAWTLAPPGIFFGLIIAGAVFARTMREREYLTMLDPFQCHYGNLTTLLIYVASLWGDLLWTASILNALGSTLSVIADLQLYLAVLISGSVTITYTTVGSMISVTYTDIVQLLFIFIGLVVSLPFIYTSAQVGDIWATKDKWLGQVQANQWGVWVDLFIAMTLGTIPWQSYFQRVLSVRTARQAQLLSCVGAFGALILVIPPVLIGMAGTNADWSNTSFSNGSWGVASLNPQYSSLILPLVINEFTTPAVSILGLGAISAAVMSSMDSAVLGSSSMFTHNLYQLMLRRKASTKELRIVQIITVIFFGGVSMVIALWSEVIYGVFILASDIVFVIIFPQLTAILYFPNYCNPVGAISGYLIGFILRLGAGEPIIKMPAWIYYPFYDEDMGEQLFPFRTFAMLVSFVTIFGVTFISRLKILSFFCERFEYIQVEQNDYQAYVRSGTGTRSLKNMKDDTKIRNLGSATSVLGFQSVDCGYSGDQMKKLDSLPLSVAVKGTFRKLEPERNTEGSCQL